MAAAAAQADAATLAEVAATLAPVHIHLQHKLGRGAHGQARAHRCWRNNRNWSR